LVVAVAAVLRMSPIAVVHLVLILFLVLSLLQAAAVLALVVMTVQCLIELVDQAALAVAAEATAHK